jgi:hypothetical protein
MQYSIDFIGGGSRVSRAHPSILEGPETISPAFGARPVPCCKRDGFVEEKQFRVMARGHYGTVPAFELQETSDPAAACVLAYDLAISGVELARRDCP